MYEINYTHSAFKQLDKLPKEITKRIVAALERSRIRPEQHFERLVGEKLYKLRVGNYRIISDIIHEELQIFVIEIDHRKRVYKT